MRTLRSVFALAVFLTTTFTLATRPAAAQDADPPSRVARLNYMQGSVAYQVAGDTTWVDADPNRPLTAGDNLWVDNNSRGELHIGSAAIRLSSQTGISFLNLDDQGVQIQLAQGTIEVHLRNLASGDIFEVDTPNLSFVPDRAGDYRIMTDPNGDSTIIVVRQGSGAVTAGGGNSWQLRAGQQYSFNGADRVSYDAYAAPRNDDFDNWCTSRNQREDNSPSARYVSRDVDGYYDLDQYGDWDSDPDYGSVWYPRSVAVDWAPYQVGHWVYVAPWGWTWIDEEPWGFAPFHYGRWAYVRNRWGWVPGPVAVRPVYAPALVAFVGGGGFGLSISIGSSFSGVAWYPLGPRDVYVPSYRCSPRYVQNVNITNTRVVNVTQVTNVYNTVYVNHDSSHVNYTYARNDRAVTAVPRDTFVGARSVRGNNVRVSAAQINQARVVESAPIAPTRSSYVAASAKISNNKPAVPFAQRRVVEQHTPAVQPNRGILPRNDNGNNGGNNGRGLGQPQPNQSNDQRGNQGGQRGGNNTVQPSGPPPATNENRNGAPAGGYHPFGQQQPNQRPDQQPVQQPNQPPNQPAMRGNGNNNVRPPTAPPKGNDNRNGSPNGNFRPFGQQQPNQRPEQQPNQQPNQPAMRGNGNNSGEPPSASPNGNDDRNASPNNGNRPFGRRPDNQPNNQPPTQQAPPTPSNVQPNPPSSGANENRGGQPNNGNRPFGRQPDTQQSNQPPAQHNNESPNTNNGRGIFTNRPAQNQPPATAQPQKQEPPAQVQQNAPPRQDSRGNGAQQGQDKQQHQNSNKQDDKKQNDKKNDQ